MKVEAAIFGSICDKCQQPILNKKGIALVDGEKSKTYCQVCYVRLIKERQAVLQEICKDKP